MPATMCLHTGFVLTYLRKGRRMNEYKVEVVEVKKSYWRVAVKADSRADAIAQARKSGLDLDGVDEHETASQIEWSASSNDPGFFSWLSSIWK